MSLAEQFIGLTKKDAQNKADMLNLIFRLVRVDDRPLQGYPEDEREDRICVEIDKTQITKATIQ